MERERREDSQERGEKRARTDTDTDVESTQICLIFLRLLPTLVSDTNFRPPSNRPVG